MTAVTTPTARTSVPDVASLNGAWRWPRAVAAALVPVVLTAVGAAAGQITGADDRTAILLIAAAAAASALLALGVMAVSTPALRTFGLRMPRSARAAGWYLVPAASIVIVLLTQGVRIPMELIGPYVVLVVAVALNEELWFRGIVLALLRPSGTGVAIIGSSVLFAVLHLANLAGGADPVGAVLQVAFAAVFAYAAALCVATTRSLWSVIAWHAAWDLANYLGGNQTSPLAYAGIGAAVVLILAWSIFMHRRLRAQDSTGPAVAATAPAPASIAPVR